MKGALLALLPWIVAGQPLTIAPAAENKLELSVEKTGLLRGKTHLFTFQRYRAAIDFHPAQPETSTVTLVIEAASIVCRDTWVSAKDLAKIQSYAVRDMLAADRNPEIRFTSAKVRATGPGRFELEGNLTIRGVTKTARAAVTLETRGGAPLFTGTAQVRLTDFGLKPPTAALGAIGTRDEMTLAFVLAAHPRPGDQKAALTSP